MPNFKTPVIRDKPYLKYVRSLPCIITGREGEDIDPAHISYGRYSQAKSGDDLVLPLWNLEHMKQHQTGEVKYWLIQANESPRLMMEWLKAYAREQYREYKSDRTQ